MTFPTAEIQLDKNSDTGKLLLLHLDLSTHLILNLKPVQSNTHCFVKQYYFLTSISIFSG